ncbi:MarR family winged helix-turn-helix transcriptional regulator [Shewanella violacea]|uniref:Transcriptional regulator, MarR family n=1 Tax=Shewanella violacea (strain JCM 10179 / CIP 106290 / LMG 19151 / DSS12) TaxID=637905 RepID=D4ZK65_SHEVD|nr:MarR family transcriptional regulator [Shewanella violacea]BAJ02064.1 transcriptional regulator, MarR family [Shewanella violacea DSS12]
MPESYESSLVLKNFLPYRLVNLAQNVSEKFSEVYQSEFNLTTPEWRILVHLAEHDDSDLVGNGQSDANDDRDDRGDRGDRDEKEERDTSTDSAGISAKELTVLASMDKSSVSRAVKLMLDKGYLIKQLDENDKRASVLALTQQGKYLYQTIAPKALAWEVDLLDTLSASEYRDLMRILDKLDNSLA